MSHRLHPLLVSLLSTAIFALPLTSLGVAGTIDAGNDRPRPVNQAPEETPEKTPEEEAKSELEDANDIQLALLTNQLAQANSCCWVPLIQTTWTRLTLHWHGASHCRAPPHVA